MTEVLDESLQLVTFNAVLEELYYQDGTCKPLTHNTLDLIKRVKPNLSEGNGLLLEGILRADNIYESFPLFSEAELKGCDHPVLYNYLGEYYLWRCNGAIRDAPRALEYYERTIAAGYMLGLRSLYRWYCDVFRPMRHSEVVGLRYLHDLELSGYVDGSLFEKIGECYQDFFSPVQDTQKAMEYTELAMDAGYPPAYLSMHRIWWHRAQMAHPPPQCELKATLVLVEAEKKGVNDTRVVHQLIEAFLYWGYAPCDKALRMFKSKEEVIMHYAERLIDKRSSKGYFWKSVLYWDGVGNIPKDRPKAVSIWQEADRLGLAEFEVYLFSDCGLIHAYKNGTDVPQDGAKALECCYKALQIAPSSKVKPHVYKNMAEIYQKGIPPIAQDQAKADELFRLANPRRRT